MTKHMFVCVCAVHMYTHRHDQNKVISSMNDTSSYVLLTNFGDVFYFFVYLHFFFIFSKLFTNF